MDAPPRFRLPDLLAHLSDHRPGKRCLPQPNHAISQSVPRPYPPFSVHDDVIDAFDRSASFGGLDTKFSARSLYGKHSCPYVRYSIRMCTQSLYKALLHHVASVYAIFVCWSVLLLILGRGSSTWAAQAIAQPLCREVFVIGAAALLALGSQPNYHTAPLARCNRRKVPPLRGVSGCWAEALSCRNRNPGPLVLAERTSVPSFLDNAHRVARQLSIAPIQPQTFHQFENDLRLTPRNQAPCSACPAT